MGGLRNYVRYDQIAQQRGATKRSNLHFSIVLLRFIGSFISHFARRRFSLRPVGDRIFVGVLTVLVEREPEQILLAFPTDRAELPVLFEHLPEPQRQSIIKFQLQNASDRCTFLRYAHDRLGNSGVHLWRRPFRHFRKRD